MIKTIVKTNILKIELKGAAIDLNRFIVMLDVAGYELSESVEGNICKLSIYLERVPESEQKFCLRFLSRLENYDLVLTKYKMRNL